MHVSIRAELTGTSQTVKGKVEVTGGKTNTGN